MPARCDLMISVVIIASVEWKGAGDLVEIDQTSASFLEDQKSDDENVSGQALQAEDGITESLRRSACGDYFFL